MVGGEDFADREWLGGKTRIIERKKVTISKKSRKNQCLILFEFYDILSEKS